MKKDKRQEIIESSIRLSAENGFFNTSVQDIVDVCGISKGAFYHYFSSKEALHVAIFQYYFDQMNEAILAIDQAGLEPREKMKQQLRVPFEQLKKQRAFFIVYLREQNFSINKELRNVIEQSRKDTIAWYYRNLMETYGEKIKPYIADIIMLTEGMQNSYLGAMLFHDLNLDTDRVAGFLLNRIDDIVQAFENGEKSIIHPSSFQHLLPEQTFSPVDAKSQVAALLTDMEEKLAAMPLSKVQKNGLHHVVHFLQNELEKPELDRYAFQGMLANLKEVGEFDRYRGKIAGLLGLQLL
ncbi:TetR family transcriptional regulator [Lentibacillus populi]|uniref:TetR family transcriptional regulator n=1 Tax=Lentibacillus populi TaxID=1827502 RepID=A0A9W5X4Z1_9BACI|nr:MULTISPECIES: TetR/AcrR family transcriptional regulator [Bacillaceae]MBT2214723.1 TetR/AcrR family transcriptional regulator [Virgibacillus dakarensis]GGB39433.1 TetR family transcriptional regulator [Lentibacillus populi]